eukprot:scaffold310_cov307-Pinguiococcus_pyrenoidosus.AAC.7
MESVAHGVSLSSLLVRVLSISSCLPSGAKTLCGLESSSERVERCVPPRDVWLYFFPLTEPAAYGTQGYAPARPRAKCRAAEPFRDCSGESLEDERVRLSIIHSRRRGRAAEW